MVMKKYYHNFILIFYELISIFICRFKNDEPLQPEPRIKVESRSKTIHSLVIDNSSLTDAAKYTLKAKNESGEVSESFKLIIQSIIFSLNILNLIIKIF
jgi:hypothetical protein